jgi:hypothetical protein
MKITVDPAILPTGFGLGIEQGAWDPQTKRFYTSIPTIANNPSGCNYGQLAGPCRSEAFTVTSYLTACCSYISLFRPDRCSGGPLAR